MFNETLARFRSSYHKSPVFECLVSGVSYTRYFQYFIQTVLNTQLNRKTCTLLIVAEKNVRLLTKRIFRYATVSGAAMKSFTMQAKMYELGVIPFHSRLRVSNDNPYSESLFRTVKYCPSWPKQGFEIIEDARKWVARFTCWYNNEHRHSQIKFVTSNQRHTGQDIQILNQRKKLYEMKKSENSSRWSDATRNWEYIRMVSLNPEKQSKVA